MRYSLLLLALTLTLLGTATVRGEDVIDPQPAEEVGGVRADPAMEDPPEIDNSSKDCVSKSKYQLWRETVPWIVWPLVVLALIIMGLLFGLMFKSKAGLTDQYFRAYSLTLIVFAGLFLIVVGWNQDQLAGMMGLLGTLAGYILGDRRN
ncbi:hypothetical protein [Aeoliella sp.]|uniref:hypothetical protein n=1 Tax=Aeoliella sp. TaxID=2795800 RepID=UPI003CCC445D